MSQTTLFIECEGALIEAPDVAGGAHPARVRFMPGVFAALAEAVARGYRLVLLTHAHGPADEDPHGALGAPHEFVLETLRSQGVSFDAVLHCAPGRGDGCECRAPQAGLVQRYLAEHDVEPGASVLIGAGVTDLPLGAQRTVRALPVRRHGAAHETWPAALRELSARRAEFARCTNETHIEVRVDLDAAAPLALATGIGFFDHMLAQLATHGGFALALKCSGDLAVDEHHTVEDCALALGEALRRALGDKSGIGRYGFVLPMDESVACVALDLSGRAFAQFSGHFPRERVGGLPTELVSHFFRSLAQGLGAALHVSVSGANAHHMVEACFKGVGRALRQGLARSGGALPSTKGVL
jgi:imidazoleglycerol-phosphate dehydratase/histidinol-phosphatase